MASRKKQTKKLMFSVIIAQKFFVFTKPARKYLRSSFLSLKKKEAKLCNAYFSILQDCINKVNNARLSLSRFVFQINQQTKSIARAEVTLFNQSSFPIKFRPNHAIQGAFVFVLTLFLAITAVTTTIPRQKTQTASIINNQSITTKQTNAVIAGSSEAVSWTKLIKKSDITTTNNKVILPKSAKNIKVQTITKTQADQIILYRPLPQLAEKDRKLLAQKSQPWLAAINFTKYLFADLEQAVTDIVEKVKDKAKDKDSKEAVIVELPIEPEPADTTALVGSEDIAVVVSPDPEPQETQEPAESEVPAEPEDDVVAVTYETPAPTITEQETTTGKTVTVSSNETETVDCELLNPNAQDSSNILEQASAGLLNGIKNIIASITKFFTAGVKEAVTDILNDSGDQNTEISARSDLAQSSEQAYQDCLASQATITNVLAHTTIPEIYKVGQEDKIKIKWKNPDCGAIEDPRQAEACRDNADVQFTAYDLNNNGKLDYVEWTVPHLSEQVFKIIFISKAWHLDSNLEILEDIYDQVATQEGTYQENTFATVPQNNFVRVTFQQVLDNANDITMYMRPNCTVGGCNASVEVYPVYEDQDGNETQGQKLDLVNDGVNPDFTNIDHEGKYRVLLTNLATPTDKFDLKVTRRE
jgi:hypothetical protein